MTSDHGTSWTKDGRTHADNGRAGAAPTDRRPKFDPITSVHNNLGPFGPNSTNIPAVPRAHPSWAAENSGPALVGCWTWDLGLSKPLQWVVSRGNWASGRAGRDLDSCTRGEICLPGPMKPWRRLPTACLFAFFFLSRQANS